MGPNEELRDYYATLGLSPDVDQREIGKAYRRLIKAIHPDARGGTNDPAAGRRVAELVEAWRVLGNKARRAEYDRDRKARSGRRSETVEMDTSAKATKETPKLIVRPGGWIIEPWEREGAPRSLVLNCSVANEGGGVLAGELEAPRWMKVEPGSFGPLKDGRSSQRVLVLVDRQAWLREGSPEGAIWLSTSEGDGREISILSRDGGQRSFEQGESRTAILIVGIVAAIAVGPAIALLAALPLALWAIFAVACLALPALLDRLHRWSWFSVGVPDLAPGWDLGPIGDRSRLLITGAAWAASGAVITGSAVEMPLGEHLGFLLPCAGALLWTWCWLSVSIRDGTKRTAERWIRPIAHLVRPVSAMATVVAWALSSGLVAHSLFGRWILDAQEAGASVGWAFGVLVVFSRSNALFPGWRSVVEATLWNVIPALAAVFGLSAGLIVIGSASAISALVPAAMSLVGFFVGILTISPSAGSGGAETGCRRRSRPIVSKAIGSIEKLFEEYAFRSLHRGRH